MKILVLNAGSSSIKYALFHFPEQTRLCFGLIEQIGEPLGCHHYQQLIAEKTVSQQQQLPIIDHLHGLQLIEQTLMASGLLNDLSELGCIGHRVVHGGELFQQPTWLNAEVIAQLATLTALAPLHNPANLLGIQVAMQLANVPQIAVFDTAFHQTLPPYAYHYPLPYQMYEQWQVRRYGFHGTSHQYLTEQAAELLNKTVSETDLIILHLGNGASACAVAQGRSVDTSMGLTPLEGLMMGTRCGDIDPAILDYLQHTSGKSLAEITHILNYDSGLKGVCGSNDMRTVAARAEQGDERAQLARQMVAYRIKKYIGAYYAVLGKIDALVFSGGIGEHDVQLRALCCQGLEHLGIALDSDKNQQPALQQGQIQQTAAATKILVIPTNEELAIAILAKNRLSQTANPV